MTAPRRAAAIAAAILALSVAAGCADDDSAGTPGATTATPTAADQRLADPAAGAMLPAGPAPGVADALADTTGEPRVVGAHLFVDPDGTARLCDAVAESFPPQCGEPSMPVTNLPPELVDGLEEKDGVRWSDGPVQLIGRMEDGTFVNDPALLAAS